ncbi:hypothetical protein JX266_011753 [Neoarthrinium moseri]|nr:hypothetical protein JX266_011753 [Neoarthrinium moseri]
MAPNHLKTQLESDLGPSWSKPATPRRVRQLSSKTSDSSSLFEPASSPTGREPSGERTASPPTRRVSASAIAKGSGASRKLSWKSQTPKTRSDSAPISRQYLEGKHGGDEENKADETFYKVSASKSPGHIIGEALHQPPDRSSSSVAPPDRGSRTPPSEVRSKTDERRAQLGNGRNRNSSKSSISTSTSTMSSQRNRGQRGANRNSDASGYGEEYALWQSIQSQLNSFLQSFNDASENVLGIRDQEHQMAEKRDAGGNLLPDFSQLDTLLRTGVKLNEDANATVRELLEKTKVLRAIQKAKEETNDQSLSRSATQRSKESVASSSVYDFDGAGDSPVPSPNPRAARGVGSSSGSKGDRDRDSVPPRLDRSTPSAKAGSVEPAGPAASIARSKVIFAKGDEVAFKPKPQNNEQTDWILGIVQDVRGEGKSRRYRVLDADVDEAGNQKDFRTSASSMIAIPKEGTPLPPLDTGKTVLALYPNTTTFYKAEVMGMDEGRVNLKFEGEESSNTMQAVGRRHVVEYRG